MLKHALIAGGTGFIGTRLCQQLAKNGYEVTIISRMPGVKRITWHQLESDGIPPGVSTVVNLAGQNVLDPSRRWTPGFKQNVWNSRINTTSALVKAIQCSNIVDTFVNISGVGHYKPNKNKVYTEDDHVCDFDFMSKLCIEWEKAATIPDSSSCRNVKIRSGVVIGRGGGMIQSIMLPFQLGLGGKIGSGKQPLPWIHIEDLCNLIQYSMETSSVKGVLNGVAPEIVTNEKFMKTFAKSLSRPALIPMIDIVISTIFGKDRAVLLLEGAKIKPKRTLETGFNYTYPTAESACNEVAGRKK